MKIWQNDNRERHIWRPSRGKSEAANYTDGIKSREFPRRLVLSALIAVLLLTMLTACASKRPYEYPDTSRESVQAASREGWAEEAQDYSATERRSGISTLVTGLNLISELLLRIACVWGIVEAVRYLRIKTMACIKEKTLGTAQEKWVKNADRAAQPSKSKSAREPLPQTPTPPQPAPPPQPIPPEFFEYHETTPDNEMKNLFSSQPVDRGLHQEAAVWFDVQDVEKLRSYLIGIDLSPLYFKQSMTGPLKGMLRPNGRYEVIPASEEITEANLNYSAINPCFHISWDAKSDKRVKVRVNSPAILLEQEAGVFQIEKRGTLTVTDSY